MIENIPNNFFNLLVSKNKDLYIDALFTLRKAIRQDLYITREDLAHRIALGLEDDFAKETISEDDGSLIDKEDLDSNMSKALYIIRKLRDFGWINIDFNAKHSFEEFIAVPSYATLAINFLYSLTNEAENEYNSLVYSTYSALKMAENDNSDYYDALISAYKNTDRLNESLASLYYGIRSIEQRIAENIELNDIVSLHFNEYLSKLHDQYYHPYKTFDSIERFRTPIIKTIKSWRQNNQIKKNIIEVFKSKNPHKKADAIYEEIEKMYDYIFQTYDEIEDKMDIIDNKINDYTATTIDKMRHLVNMDETFKGKVTYLTKLVSDNKEHADEVCEEIINHLNLSCQENLCKEGLYNKREIQITTDISVVEIETIDKEGNDVDLLLDKIKEGYNANKIKEFIINRAKGNKEVSMEEIRIASDEDFILSILAMLRGDEKELPFKVEFHEGYLKVKNYLVPNLKFIMKEGRR